jgi:hypothetical protein
MDLMLGTLVSEGVPKGMKQLMYICSSAMCLASYARIGSTLVILHERTRAHAAAHRHGCDIEETRT